MIESTPLRKTLFRVVLVLLWPFLFFTACFFCLIDNWSWILEDTKEGYREWPKAFRKGGPV